MTRNTRGLLHGGPGRKKGVPNKITREAKAFCQGLVNDPRYIEKFTRAFVQRKLPHRIEEMVWAYAYGKPSQLAEVPFQAITSTRA